MAAPPTNYSDLYRSIPDPYAPNLDVLLTPFGADAAQPSNTELRNRVVGAPNNYPKLFVATVGDPVRIVALHRTTKFISPLGAGAPQWEDQIFAFMGDLSTSGIPSVVNWPGGAFNRCVAARVNTLATMEAAWAAAPAQDMTLGPYAAGDADTEQVQVRFLCPVPAHYSHLVMTRTHTPREFWTRVISPIIADGNGGTCSVLVDWGRVVCTLSTQAGNNPDVQSNFLGDPGLTAPLADATLHNMVSSWIHQDLPARALGSTPLGLQQQVANQNAQLQALVQTQVANANKVNTVTDKFPNFAVTLRHLCNANTDADLPTLWNQLANAPRAERTAVVEYALMTRADEVALAGPVVTPELVDTLVGFRFTSQDLDDLTSGLSIFKIISAHDPQATAARNRSTVYATLQAGNVAPTLDDTKQLMENAPKMPSGLVALLQMLRAYSILLDVVFGGQHPLALAYQRFVRRWDQSSQNEINAHFDAHAIAPFCPLVVRRVQLLTQVWINEAATSLVLPVGPQDLPRYGDIIRDVTLRNWPSFQTIPRRYLQTPTPSRGTSSQLPPANDGGTGGASRGGSSGSNSAAERVTNTGPNPALTNRYSTHQGRLGDLIRQHAEHLPKADNDRDQICLSYCLTGGCNSNCRRRATHRPLTTTEEARVEGFLAAAGL